MGINDTLADDITTLSVRVAQFTKAESKKILGNLEELGRDLERQIRAADFESTTPARQQARLKSLSRDVNESIREAYFGDGGNSEVLQGTLSEVGPFTQQGAAKAINSAIGGPVTRLGLNPTEMRVLTQDPVVLGNTTQEHWTKQTVNLQQSFVREMRLGISQGETNDQLVNRVRGTRVKGQTEVVEIDGKRRKVPVREGGIMNVSRREAEALVRSSTQTVSNTTLEETYKANSDIISGVAVLVTLDGSTTKICISLSGGRWNLITGDPLPDSVVQEPYPGAPPYHWSCRTIIAPITRSWDELARGAKGRVTRAVTNPARTRASMDGEVPGEMTYDGFLRRKEKVGPGFANSVLGKGRAELWRQGKIQLNQLTDENLRELSLAELRALAA